MAPTLLVLAGLLAAHEHPALPLPALAPADLGPWRERVRPTADEDAHRAIPWVPSFAAGLERADAEGRPLLFWAMNGHPLGCT